MEGARRAPSTSTRLHRHSARTSPGTRGNHNDFARPSAGAGGAPARGGPPLCRPLGADRGARGAAGLLRHHRSDKRLPGRLRGGSRGGPPRPVEARLQLRRRPVQRRDLGADRDRVHPGLRDHRTDQLRPRRRVHDRLLHRRGPVGDARARAHHGGPGARRRPDRDPDHHDDRDGVAERPDRAGRLPAAAGRAQARVADHRGRLLVHPAERRACSGAGAHRRACPT